MNEQEKYFLERIVLHGHRKFSAETLQECLATPLVKFFVEKEKISRESENYGKSENHRKPKNQVVIGR